MMRKNPDAFTEINLTGAQPGSRMTFIAEHHAINLEPNARAGYTILTSVHGGEHGFAVANDNHIVRIGKATPSEDASIRLYDKHAANSFHVPVSEFIIPDKYVRDMFNTLKQDAQEFQNTMYADISTTVEAVLTAKGEIVTPDGNSSPGGEPWVCQTLTIRSNAPALSGTQATAETQATAGVQAAAGTRVNQAVQVGAPLGGV